MSRKLITTLLLFSMLVTSAPALAASPVPGKSCSAIGKTQSTSTKKFTCVAKKSKRIWNSGVPIVKAYSPKGYFGNRCDRDPSAKGDAAKIQEFLSANRRCVQAMKIVKANLPSQRPKSTESADSLFLDSTLCKSQNSASSNSWKGFPSQEKAPEFKTKRHPSPTTVMQIIPIYSSDAPKGSTTPYQDYKYYFDFIKDYFNYIDDSGGRFELRVPESYVSFPNKIADYGIRHGKDDDLSRNFIQDVISTVDKDINFNEINYSLVIVPAGTPSGVIGQQGFGRALSSEGYITNLSVAHPATFAGTNNLVNTEMASPSMWLHEFYHPGLNLGDNHAKESRNYDDERGMGDWGLMSRNNGDLLAWQKWILGFATDQQIRCVNRDAPSTTSWLAPSSVKSSRDKLLVIPLGSSRSIVVESIRAVGISYRYAADSLGALVYVVDSSDVRHEYGYTVMYPDTRRPTSTQYAMADATLKVGESVTIEGFKITNIEWGDFGDVLKVEHLN